MCEKNISPRPTDNLERLYLIGGGVKGALHGGFPLLSRWVCLQRRLEKLKRFANRAWI
jgi:hypothetical protein